MTLMYTVFIGNLRQFPKRVISLSRGALILKQCCLKLPYKESQMSSRQTCSQRGIGYVFLTGELKTLKLILVTF